MTLPTVRFALLTLCVGLASIVAAEAFVLMPTYAESSKLTDRNASSRNETIAALNLDAMVAAILARPLFSSTRLPPAIAAPEEVVVPEKQPPRLQARLTGISLGPNAREALFERDGEKPIPVKVGGEIDGWKVSAIQFDQVVLSSEFGNQIVKPTNAPPGAEDEEAPPAAPKSTAKAIKAAANAARPPGAAGTKASAPSRQQGRK